MNIRKDRKGFTLIELIIIIIILGILAAVAIPRYLDMRSDAVNATVKGVLGGMRGANSILWGNRVISNNTATYTMGEILSSMEMKGGAMSSSVGNYVLTLTVGASSFQFTMGTTGAIGSAQPPTTYAQIFLATVGATPVDPASPYTMW